VSSFVRFISDLLVVFGQQVYSPKQWVNFRSEGTSHLSSSWTAQGRFWTAS
jgi:hypothetical protein